MKPVRLDLLRLGKSRRTRRFAPVLALMMLWTFHAFPCLAAAVPPSQLRVRFTPSPRHPFTPSKKSLASHSPTLPIRPLSVAEMQKLFGAGDYRDQARCGQLPWWRLYKGVNVVNGNLYRSYTDLSYPSRMMNVSFVRTYNSNEDQADARGPDALRTAPFGRGWGFSYDLQCYADPQDPTLLDRQTANGAEIPYEVDADGLVTPPVYVHDKTSLTERMLRTPDGLGGFTNTILEYDMDGNRLDNNPIPQADNNEFFLEFTRESKDGGKTIYKSFERAANGDPTGYYKATRIEDRYGNAMTYTYGLEVTLPGGKKDSLLTAITDTVGRNVILTWANVSTSEDPHWRIVAVTDPINRTWTYQYTTANCEVPTLWRVTDPANRTTTYTYATIGVGASTEYALLASEQSPMGRTTGYTYKLETGFMPTQCWVSKVTEPSGHEWTLTAFSTFPHPVVEVAGERFQFWLDSYRRIATYTQEWQGTLVVGWSWNNAFQMTSYLKNVDGTWPTIKMTYDAVFDAQGNVTEPGQGKMLTTAREYTTQPTDTSTFTYWDETKYYQVATTTDPLNRVTAQDYFTKDDPVVGNRGNLWKVTDARNGVTEFSYNQYGQKASMKDAEGRIWTYAYTVNGDLQKTTWPDGTFTEATYDSIGRPTQTRDRKAQLTSITYNLIGQPTSISFADGSSVTYAYNNDGQVTSVTDARGTTTYIYDVTNGNVLSVTDPVTGMVGYDYNPFGARTKTTLPNGKWISHFYFQRGMLLNGNSQATTNYVFQHSSMSDVQVAIIPNIEKVTDPWGYETTGVYFPNGEVYSLEASIAKDPTTGASTCSFKHRNDLDTKGRLLRARTLGVPNMPGFEYDYSATDNRDHMYEIDQNNVRTATETYAYDELSRLTNVTYKDNATQAYTFDKVGNRLTLVNQPANQQTNYTYNAVNELTSSTDGTHTYDLNGNTLTDPQRSYTWDVQNRLTSVTKGNTTVNFTYRTDGLRASKEVVGTSKIDYIYDGQTVIGEIHKNASGTVTKKVWYTPGPNGYLNRTETDPNDVVTNKEWFVYDGLGSTRAMVKPNAAGIDAIITARFDYDVYGKVRTSTGSTNSSFRYVGGSCGHPTDDETGLIYMRARYYDPGTGRFVKEDPKQNDDNWYAYASSNPVNAVDQSGESAIFTVIFFAIGSLLAHAFHLSHDIELLVHGWFELLGGFFFAGTYHSFKHYLESLNAPGVVKGELKMSEETFKALGKPAGKRGKGITTYDSVTTYLLTDPVDFVGILSDISGGMDRIYN